MPEKHGAFSINCGLIQRALLLVVYIRALIFGNSQIVMDWEHEEDSPSKLTSLTYLCFAAFYIGAAVKTLKRWNNVVRISTDIMFHRFRRTESEF